jgi:hypothetical protein
MGNNIGKELVVAQNKIIRVVILAGEFNTVCPTRTPASSCAGPKLQVLFA